MATASVTIDRSSISLGDLVIADSGATRLLEVSEPEITWRITKMPDNPHIHGSEPVGAAKEETALPFGVRLIASSAAELDAAYDALIAALDQFSFNITLTVDGRARIWAACPGSYARGPILLGEQAALVCAVKVNVPLINPIPGS